MKDTGAEKRQQWQDRLAKAKNSYQQELNRMDIRRAYYKGTHETKDANGNLSSATKKAINVRNIVYELIESQVDSTVPMPKVTALHKEDAELAKQVESLLANEARRMGFKEMNDLMERIVPIQGGDFWHLEWDANGGNHCTMGELSVTERNPRQVIPQPGIYDIEKMDYVFVQISQSKKAIKRRYGIDVEDDVETEPHNRSDSDAPVENLVTQNIAYYRNENGGIGMFSWVGNQTLEDLENYQARRTKVCKKCGTRKTGEKCPVCGGKVFIDKEVDEEELTSNITIADGVEIEQFTYGEDTPILNPDGTPQLDEMTGEVIMQPGEKITNTIPYYRPDAYPIILRRNVRDFGHLLGNSDVDVIEDQQDAINKYGTKIQEKILKGGSYVTLPQDVSIETTDRELKVIPIKDPAQKALIGVINVQPDTSRDQQMLETNYSWAKSSLGVTDAFQGKYDASATSGTAKQFSANQAAGRLQSKREMKNMAFAHLYKLMFQFLLAYSEDAVPIVTQGADGENEYSHFTRYAFLKRDAAGELYWNDEFLFEVDPSSTLLSNRDAAWNMVAQNYQAGAFGPIGELKTLNRLWMLLSDLNHPSAKTMLANIREEMAEQAMAEQQMMMGGMPNAMP